MISSIVLTHNSSTTLARTLESLHWSDEIIVVDDNSTDNTLTIAKKYHAKFFIRSLDNDFAAQRNFGLLKAIHDWVLFVDSDEVVSKELSQEILNPPAGGRDDMSVSGYYIKRTDVFWQKKLRYGETGNIELLRLAKKNVGKWMQPVHEVWTVQGETGHLQHSILHYAHPTISQFLESINRYSSLYANYLYTGQIKESGWRVVINPLGKFLINYVWRLGFLDGVEGAIYAIMMSFHSFLVRAKLWHMWQKG